MSSSPDFEKPLKLMHKAYNVNSDLKEVSNATYTRK